MEKKLTEDELRIIKTQLCSVIANAELQAKGMGFTAEEIDEEVHRLKESIQNDTK